jgi:hypothetical protein
MDTRTTSGDIYIMDENTTLVYGSRGIELSLTSRNVEVLRNVKLTQESAKDQDGKDRRFMVGYDAAQDMFRFEPNRGEIVHCPAWQFTQLV